MKTQPIITLLLALFLVALTGCATYPISKNLRKQSQPVTLGQVLNNPDAVRGTTVIWGGRIIKTVNDTNGAAIYVLALPLNHYERPKTTSSSLGRFIARSKQFLEPQILRKGRLVTVAGIVAGVETHGVQNTQYQYPVLDLQQFHLWPRYRHRYWHQGWYYPYGYWDRYPGWGPGWGWYLSYPYPPDWDWDWD